MASVFRRKGDKRWTIAYFDHEGKRCEKASGTTDKRLAERIASELSDRELERVRGLVDPAAERLATHRTRPLAEHFDDYGADLDSLQRDTRHVEGTLRYLRKVADALEWGTLASIDAQTLTAYLSAQAETRGTGARTFNAAATAWRAFGRWCVRSNRLASNPLAGLRTRSIDGDRRRVRRDVSTDELARIIEAAERSPFVTVPKAVRNAEGVRRTVATRMYFPERAWAYRIAAGTGFRAGEVASLTRESFDLEADTPSVVVEAAYSKRKRRDVQPIRPDLADLLRPWLASKPAGARVCPLPDGKAGLLLRADMDAARAAWIAEARTPAERAEREGSDFLRHTDSSGRVVDFHGLRVHFISRVVEAGANVKEAMDLARHSDPKLTLRTYAKVSMHNLSRVLDGMPKADTRPTRVAETMRATGTDDRTVSAENECPQRSPHSERRSGKVGAAGRDESDRANAGTDSQTSLKLAGSRDDARQGATPSGNAPRRTRTFDPLIKSQLLYQLS
jgi:integrase